MVMHIDTYRVDIYVCCRYVGIFVYIILCLGKAIVREIGRLTYVFTLTLERLCSEQFRHAQRRWCLMYVHLLPYNNK